LPVIQKIRIEKSTLSTDFLLCEKF
jgi:hypothetical protein